MTKPGRQLQREHGAFAPGAWAHGKDPGPALRHRPGGQGGLSLEVLELIVESLAELNPLALDEMRDHLPELGGGSKSATGRRLSDGQAQGPHHNRA